MRSVGKARRRLAAASALSLAFFALSLASLEISRTTGNLAAIWLSAPLLLAVLVRHPPKDWPLFIAACVPAEFAADALTGERGDVALGLLAGDMAGILVAALLLWRLSARPFVLNGFVPLLQFAGCAVLAGPMAGGLIGALVLWQAYDVGYVLAWQQWWSSTGLGALVVGAALLAWPVAREERALVQGGGVELAALVATGAGLLMLAVGAEAWPLLFLLSPVLLWAAARFGVFVTACGGIALAGAAIGFVLVDRPLPGAPGTDDLFAQIQFVQLLLAAMLLPALMLAASLGERARATQALAASERKLRAVFDQSFQHSSLLDVDGTVRESNLGGLDPITPADAVVGRLLWEAPLWLSAPASQARLRAAVERAARGEAVELEESVRRSTGRQLTLELSLRPARDEQGRVAFLIAEARDISQRKQVEAALREAEERFRTLVEHAPEAVVLLDPAAQRFVDANENAARLFGLPRERLLLLGPLDLSPPLQADGQASQHKAAAFIEAAVQGRTPAFEWLHLDAEGAEIPCEVRLARLRLANQVLVRGSITDISERKRAEARLRRSEAMLADAQRIAHMGSWESDLRTGIITWSAQVYEILGVKRENFTPSRETLLALAHPDDRAKLDATRGAAVAGTAPYDIEFRIVLANGEIRIVHSIAEIERDADGTARRIVGTVHDITRRKRAEEALTRSEQDFRALFERNPSPMWIYDHDSLRFLEVNAMAVRTYGYSREEFLAMSILDIRPEEDVEAVAAVARTRQGPNRDRGQWRHRLRDGRVIHVEVQGYELTYQDRPAVLTVVHDVTDRVASAQALRASEERFRALISEAGQGILVHRDFRPLYANDAVAEIFGYDGPEEVLALPSIETLFSPDDWPRVSGYKKLREQGLPAPETYEFRGVRRDGSEVIIENRVVMVPWGEDLAICANMFDVTESRATEEALRRVQRLDAVGKLTGGIAHDFNNLLGIMIGNLGFLQRMVARDQPAAERVEKVLRAAHRGARLTDRLLGFARREPAIADVLDVNAVIREVEEILVRSLAGQIEVELDLADEPWPVEADPGDLQDALVNLALNARDAMPDGGRLVIGTVNRRVRRRRGNGARSIAGDHVVISVTDFGAGMGRDVLEHALEPFFTTKPEGQGTGLGLSMVYGFCQRSRGDIRIDSRPGRGTTVRLFLPRARAAVRRDEIQIDRGQLPRGSETVLVVDDEPELLELAERMLRRLGYRTITADNAASAMAVLGNGEPVDLLFTDVVMPGGENGIELAKQARKARPRLKVLLTSGFPGDQSWSDDTEGLLDGMLHKPYDRTQLAHRVRDALDRA